MKLTCPTQDFTRAIRACSHAASRDRTRVHLSAVWVRAMPDRRSHVYATNGHWLAVVRLQDAVVEEPGTTPIDIDDVPRVLAAAPKGNHGGPVSIVRGEKSATFGFGGPSSIIIACAEVQPVPIQDVCPKGLSKKKHERISFSADIMLSVATALKSMKPGKRNSIPMRFYAMGASAIDPAIIWSPAVRDFFALVMPMRTDGKRDMAWWHETVDALNAMKAPPVPTSAAAAE